MEISDRLLQKLMEIGFMATSHGLSIEAEHIFEGLRNFHPDSEYPLIGLAVNKMNRDRHSEAIRLLREEALSRNPENDLIRGYLGMAYLLDSKRNAARLIFNEVVNNNRNKEAVRMAKHFLKDLNQ